MSSLCHIEDFFLYCPFFCFLYDRHYIFLFICLSLSIFVFHSYGQFVLVRIEARSLKTARNFFVLSVAGYNGTFITIVPAIPRISRSQCPSKLRIRFLVILPFGTECLDEILRKCSCSSVAKYITTLTELFQLFPE